ncbi:MAG: hypothetical protein SWQ30_05135 [Thermodesulfobacteriota bacterium]|nr:hypothetical protein [Thermodesulfobacteriota bacterium]
MKKMLSTTGVFLLVFMFFTPYVHCETYVSGMINENTTWSVAGSPYVVTNYISVKPGATLTIEAGVEVRYVVEPFRSHQTHFDSAGKGPGITECTDCHATGDFKDGQPLSSTEACDPCHSPGPAEGFNGSAMAKTNWDDGVYDENDNLTAGNERWCASCHDAEPANAKADGTGVSAPNVVGEDTNDDDILDYGYYVSGHKVDCLICHDATRAHIDNEHRTFKSSLYNHRGGYRLRNVDGQPPMRLPRNIGNPITNWTDFRLCFSCHGLDRQLSEIPTDPSVPHTNFWNDDSNDENAHFLHLSFASQHFDSDYDGTPDSAESCVACHNVHGSPTPAMTRHGELIDAVPGLDFVYYKAGPAATATWTSPALVGGGDYNVYAWWTSNEFRAQDVTYTVIYDGGTATVYPVDQTSNGGTWNSLGTFHYDTSSSGSVMVDNSFTLGSWVVADAVRWEKVGGGDDVIVDNPDASYTPSDWPVSTGFPDQRYGDDFQYYGSRAGVLDPTATVVDSVGGKTRMAQFTVDNGICDACHASYSYYRNPYLAPEIINTQPEPYIVPNNGLGSSLLTAQILDPYDSATVTIDLGPIGGASDQALHDDGTNGDAEDGDSTYSFQYDIPFSIPEGTKLLDVVAANPSGTDEDVLELQVLNALLTGLVIYVDNPDATFVCGWGTSTAFPEQKFGPDFRYIAAGSTTDCEGTWVPAIPPGEGGNFSVYAMWSSNPWRATSVPYTIHYEGGGTHTEWVDQTHDGGTWYPLGTYPFAEGSSGSVVVRADDATGGAWVIADAIKLEKAY